MIHPAFLKFTKNNKSLYMGVSTLAFARRVKHYISKKHSIDCEIIQTDGVIEFQDYIRFSFKDIRKELYNA